MFFTNCKSVYVLIRIAFLGKRLKMSHNDHVEKCNIRTIIEVRRFNDRRNFDWTKTTRTYTGREEKMMLLCCLLQYGYFTVLLWWWWQLLFINDLHRNHIGDPGKVCGLSGLPIIIQLCYCVAWYVKTKFNELQSQGNLSESPWCILMVYSPYIYI